MTGSHSATHAANGSSWWSAPTATHPVNGTVTVPGSKSMTNRALVIAALASTPSIVHGPLLARDTRLMISGLQAMGVAIEYGDNSISVHPEPLTGPARVDCGLAGTVMRFLPPVAALATGPVVFDGDEQARERPLAETIQSLMDLDVAVDDGGRGTLPFIVSGVGAVRGGEIELDAARSSQFVSALLLSAPRFDNPTTLTHRGGPLPSLPHIAMTVGMLRHAGAVIEEADNADGHSWRVQPSELHVGELVIEPDLSNAVALLATAMVTGGTVTVPDIPVDSVQPLATVMAALEALGGQWHAGTNGLTVTGPSELQPVDLDLRAIGELAPTIAAMAVLADGTSHLRGIGHLRGHETDRLLALETELSRIGAKVVSADDGLTITGGRLHGADLHTYHDHRMATAAAIIGLVVPGVRVENIATTGKTLPDFVGMWTELVASAVGR